MSTSRTPAEEKFVDALEKGQLDVVDLMLETGEARITMPIDSYGMQPIHMAAGKGNVALIELLVRHGADVNAKDNDSETPLMTAARWDEPEALKKLIDLGAAFDTRDKGGMTALFGAAMNNKMKVVEILTGAGADPNVATDSGLTALFAAALRGHFNVAKHLVDCGARLEQKGHGLGITEFAEMVSRSGGDKKMVSDFLSATKLGKEAVEGTAEKVTAMKPLTFRKPS